MEFPKIVRNALPFFHWQKNNIEIVESPISSGYLNGKTAISNILNDFMCGRSNLGT